MVYKLVSKTSIYPHLHSSIVSMPRHKLAYVNPIIHYAKRETLLNMIQSAVVNENTFSDLSKWIMVNNVRRSQLCIFYIYMYINYVTFLAHTKIISFNNVHVIIDIAICIRYLLVSNLMIFKISIIIDLNHSEQVWVLLLVPTYSDLPDIKLQRGIVYHTGHIYTASLHYGTFCCAALGSKVL